MAYRNNTLVTRADIEKSMDSINSDILSIGVHPVVIEEVSTHKDFLVISFKDTFTKLYTKPDSYLFNSLIAAVSFADRDLLWELKNDNNFDLLVGMKLKAVVGVGWGHTLIKQRDDYLVVDTKTQYVVNIHDNYITACRERDELGRAYLNIYKCLPHSKEIAQQRTLSKIQRLSRRLKGEST